MKTLGFCIQKNVARYAVVDGGKRSPQLLAKGRLQTPDPEDVPALMDWFDTQFTQLIADHKPDLISYKLSLEPNLAQQHYLSFPFGLLNLTAHRQGVTIQEFSSSGITPKKLDLPKGTNLYELVDSTFGTHPPHWDKYQQEAILVAWFCQ